MASTSDVSAPAASSSVNFYALLSLTSTATDAEIRTAFRKTSLKYHPDKVGDTPENVEKFLLVKTAHDVLSDPKIRVLYDRTREVEERKKVETEKLEAGRRKMVNDLERREREAKSVSSTGLMGVKRSRQGEEETLEQKLEREISRISEENRQKKSTLIERLERERFEEEQRLADEKEARGRLNKAKEDDGLRNQKSTPKFTFAARASQPEAPSKSSMFEQTILERLKMAQRQKERKKQAEEEKIRDNGDEK